MSDLADLMPKLDNRYDLGGISNRWARLYCLQISDGVVTRNVDDLALKSEASLLSILPSISSADEGKFLSIYNKSLIFSPGPPGLLPPITSADNGMYMVVVNGNWVKAVMPVLPPVTVSNNGDILKVDGGQWRVSKPPISLPPVTALDNGKILQVYDAKWEAMSPPSTTLPIISIGDHGSVLRIVEYEWTKFKLGRATNVNDGLVPKLPGVAGRILLSDNTWGAAPSGASGQWRIGDIRQTVRGAEPGWRAMDGSSIVPSPTDLTMLALYLKLGGTPEGWDAGTPMPLANIAGAYIRFLPDTQASVDFGIMLDVDGGIPGDVLNFELELYRNPSDVNYVLQANTYFKVGVQYSFDTSAGHFESSAPGFFWFDQDKWRLFRATGEFALPEDKAQVLFDTAEAAYGTGMRELISAGAYYYRYRQVTKRGGSTINGAWHWGRILTTGGLSREDEQVVKLCDVFSTGHMQDWLPPATAVTMYAVSEAGMEEVLADGGDRIYVGTNLHPGSRIAIVGHGNLKVSATPSRMDMFGVLPQYTAVSPEPSPPVITVQKPFNAPKSFNVAISRGKYTILATNSQSGGYLDHARVDNDTGAMDVNSNGSSLVMNGGHFSTDMRYFYGFINGAEHAIRVPEADTNLYYDTSSENVLFKNTWKPISVDTTLWLPPYFLSGFYVGGKNYLIPGEAPGIWDCDSQNLIGFPPGTVFKGGPAATIGGDGCIYCLPRFTSMDVSNTRSTGMLRFDPVGNAISFISVPWELADNKNDQFGWRRAVTLKDGRILFVPYGEPDFVIYDVRYKSLTRTNFGAAIPTGFKWENAFVLNDGSVVGCGTDIQGRGSLSFKFNPDLTELGTFTFPFPLTNSLRAVSCLKDGSIVAGAHELILNLNNVFFIRSGVAARYFPGTYSPLVNPK